MSLPDADAARARGLLPDAEASTDVQCPKPDAAPAVRIDHVDWWRPEDLEPLKSRRAWKHEGRRVVANTPPRHVTHKNGQPVRLFAASQTRSEAEHNAARRTEIEALIDAWREQGSALEAELAAWGRAIDTTSGPDAELALTLLMQARTKLRRSRASLAQQARSIELSPPSFDDGPWCDAVMLYRMRCFDLVSAEEFVTDDALARDVHGRVMESLADAGGVVEPMLVPPYWQYFGRFQKVYERIVFEREIASATRIRDFHTLFRARRLERRFTLYLGPTNSGKTYRALRRLSEVRSGTYLAPLRLLALEVAETLNEWGTPCNMITGEERIELEGARHTASTIEMLDLGAHFDVCVIDEAQMLGDVDRGWAWTQAILGAMADEVCVIAAPEAEPAIARLLELTGESYEVVRTERLTPLEFLAEPVMRFSALEPGTALVAFSRAGVLELKAQVEDRTGYRAAVVYGALPPEVRRLQAKLFASGEAPILCATDAIGMGLNLPIKTILFTQDEKYYDHQSHPITPMEARQIGGRAGRFGQNEAGWLGTFRCPPDRVLAAWQTPPPSIERAHLAPVIEHLEAIAGLSDRKRPGLAHLFSMFNRSVKPDPRYYRLADLEDQMVLARIADQHPTLSLSLRFLLSGAPVTLRNTHAVSAFERMVASVATRGSLKFDAILGDGLFDPRGRLASLESEMQVVNLYCWIHYRFPERVPDLHRAERRRRRITGEIDALLARQVALTRPRRSGKREDKDRESIRNHRPGRRRRR